MSTTMLGKVWPLRLPSTPKIVLVSLADQANDDGVCWPGVGSICLRTSFSDRAVQNAIKHLETWGYVKRVERKGRSTYYTVTPEAGSPPKDAHPEAGSPTPARRSGAPEAGSPTPEAGSPITINEPSLNHQGNAPKPARAPDALFESVAEVCGLDWKNLTKMERGRLNVSVSSLREINATPAQVRERARAYRKLWSLISLTPTALAANWGQCVAKVTVTSGPAYAPPPSQLDNNLEIADYEARRLRLPLRGSDELPQTYIERVSIAVDAELMARHQRARAQA